MTAGVAATTDPSLQPEQSYAQPGRLAADAVRNWHAVKRLHLQPSTRGEPPEHTTTTVEISPDAESPESWAAVWLCKDLPARFPLLAMEIGNDVLHFCRRERVLNYLPVALELIDQSFPSARALRVEVEHDPETGDEWLTLNFTVHGETDDILDQHDEYTDRWISAVPWPERDKICLCFDVV